MKRIFIAIPIAGEKEFLAAFKDLRSHLADEAIKWVEEFNLHLTLKFLGNTEERKIEEVKEILQLVSANYSRFEFSLKGFGYFGPKKNPNVIFAGIGNQEILKQMAGEIDKNITGLGFEPESRQYKAHLTIGRIKLIRHQEEFLKAVSFFEHTFFQNVWAEKLILYESILTWEGPLYKPLFTLPL